MKTNDLEKALGLSKHTIRYYEKEGFINPERDENGYRHYSDEDIQVLQLVKFLRNLNISIDDVKAIINGNIGFQECLKNNQIHLEKQIESMKEVKQTVDHFVAQELPLIPALGNIRNELHKEKFGFQKTTNTISLGRKLTKSWARRKLIYNCLPSLFTGCVCIFLVGFMLDDFPSLWIQTVLFMGGFVICQLLLIASSFQNSSVFLRDTIDHSMNQSIEFLENGVRYYQMTSFMNNLKYFFAVIMGKEDDMMHYYPYNEIQEVCVDARRRYMSVGSPIAYEVYAPDFHFTFSDKNQFYFYWPMTLDDDCRYIAYILEDKIKNIKDSQNILYALKQGINLTDYLSNQ